MEKKQLVKSVLISLLLFIFSGCGYKFINKGVERAVYVRDIENMTLQPKLEIYLSKQLTDVIVKYPSLTLVSSKDIADYILTVKLYKTNRTPLFYSRDNSDEIVSTRFEVEGEVILEKDNKIYRRKFKQKFSYPVSKRYEEEKVLSRISKKIAIQIYSIIIENE